MCLYASGFGSALGQGLNDLVDQQAAGQQNAEQRDAERAARQRFLADVFAHFDETRQRSALQLTQPLPQQAQRAELFDFHNPDQIAELNAIGRFGATR
jgi:hypothetical protein